VFPCRRQSHLRNESQGFVGQKNPEISAPYDVAHLTHVGFNSATGEFTGLPKEWQQPLSDSGISRLERARNPETVTQVMKLYQETQGVATIDDALDRMSPDGEEKGSPPPSERSSEVPSKIYNGFQNPRPLPRPPTGQSPYSFGPAPSAASPVAPSFSLDRSMRQRPPLSQSPLPDVSRSKSQREAPRAPSLATRRASSQTIPRGHHVDSQRHDLSHPCGDA
jgi:p21-activated kinase 1